MPPPSYLLGRNEILPLWAGPSPGCVAHPASCPNRVRGLSPARRKAARFAMKWQMDGSRRRPTSERVRLRLWSSFFRRRNRHHNKKQHHRRLSEEFQRCGVSPTQHEVGDTRLSMYLNRLTLRVTYLRGRLVTPEDGDTDRLRARCMWTVTDPFRDTTVRDGVAQHSGMMSPGDGFSCSPTQVRSFACKGEMPATLRATSRGACLA
jgi:hypothetical protein